MLMLQKRRLEAQKLSASSVGPKIEKQFLHEISEDDESEIIVPAKNAMPAAFVPKFASNQVKKTTKDVRNMFQLPVDLSDDDLNADP